MTTLLTIRDKDDIIFKINEGNLLPNENGNIYPIKICVFGSDTCVSVDEVDQIIGTLLAWRKKYYEENGS